MRTKYSQEEKNKIISEYENGVKTVKEISNEYKIDVSTLYYWRSLSGKVSITNEMRKKPHTLLREKNAELVQEKKKLEELMGHAVKKEVDLIETIKIRDATINLLRIDLQASEGLLNDGLEDRNKIKKCKLTIDDLNKDNEELQVLIDKVAPENELLKNSLVAVQRKLSLQTNKLEEFEDLQKRCAQLESQLDDCIALREYMLLRDKYNKLLGFLREE